MDYRHFKGPLHHGSLKGMVCDRVYAVPGMAFLDDMSYFCCWCSALKLKACVMGLFDTSLFMTMFTYVSGFNHFVSGRPHCSVTIRRSFLYALAQLD